MKELQIILEFICHTNKKQKTGKQENMKTEKIVLMYY